MTKKKESREEEFVFEFYDEDYAKSLEDIEKSVKKEEYNEIDFEEGKKFFLSHYLGFHGVNDYLG